MKGRRPSALVTTSIVPDGESAQRSATLPNPSSPGAGSSWTSPWFKRKGPNGPGSPWWNRSASKALTYGSSSGSAILDAEVEPRRTVSSPHPSTMDSKGRRRRRRRKADSTSSTVAASENVGGNLRALESNRSTSTQVLKDDAQRLVREAKLAAEAKARRERRRRDPASLGGSAEKHREWIQSQKERGKAEGRGAAQLPPDWWLTQARHWIRDTGAEKGDPAKPKVMAVIAGASRTARARDAPSRTVGAGVEDIFSAPGGASHGSHNAHKLGLADILNRAK